MATKATAVASTAMAIASRASRACDVCASKSAGWYCAADAAFLCDRCDTQVHSANSLAQRHERVRLTPTGAPMKPLSGELSESPNPTKPTKPTTKLTKPAHHHSHNPPPQVLPARKRTRTSRPHPHRPPRAPDQHQGPEIVNAKVEDSIVLFPDLFDTEDFLINHPQEVPSLITDLPTSPGSSYEYSPLDSPLDSPGSATCFSPESFHCVGSPEDSSFASCFKRKAAQDDHVQFGFVVPENEHGMADELGLVPTGIDIICCDADGNISLAGDACFVPGDIPGLEAFDDCSLSFDLALRGAAEAFEGDRTGTVAPKNVVEADHFATGPFARYFVTKPKWKPASASQWSPEIIKSEAREILRCCTEGEGEATAVARPTLRLNYEEIIAAWSDRGEPWVHPAESCNIAATDVGLVPDLGLPAEGGDDGTADDHEAASEGGSGGREARVLRYKEKRRSRLFTKKIRYEVRKLNAERRPRMKGRFVKRTNIGVSWCATSADPALS